MLEFREPLLLLTSLLAIPLYIVLRRPVGHITFSALQIWDSQKRSWRAKTAFIPPLLCSAALIFLSIALAGPRVAGGYIKEHRQGIDIMMVVDKSGSMAALDMSTKNQELDRLEAVKNIFVQFVRGDGKKLRGRPDDAIGIVSFASYPDSDCPLTLDHISVVNIAKNLEIVTDRNESGTAIGDALGLAVERLRQSKSVSKVIILLTDGVNNTGVELPMDAAKMAQSQGIKLYTVGVGSNGFAPVRIEDPFTGRKVLRSFPVEIDEKSLQEMAEITGGAYFRATDNNSLKAVYEKIDQLEKSKISEDRYTQYDEKFAVYLAIALVLAAIALLLQSSVYRRSP
ncbi:MAG: VWA domain-containing protein [Bradymonadales bacterium]|jgi:Ca-activated chloride channel family protein